MAIQVNTADTNPESSGGGKYINEKCDCHFSIKDVRVISSARKNTPGVEVTVKAESSTVPSQIGREHTERFYLSGKGVDRFLQFACATGLYSLVRWDEDRQAGRNADFDEQMLLGRQFCAPVEMLPFTEEDERRCQERLAECQAAGDADGAAKWEKRLQNRYPQAQVGGDKGFTFWALGDPEADHVPLDPQAIAMFGGMLPTKHGGLRRRGDGPTGRSGAPIAPAPVSTPPANPAVAAADDLF